MLATMDIGDWRWRTMEKPLVDSTAGDRSFRLLSTHLKAFLVIAIEEHEQYETTDVQIWKNLSTVIHVATAATEVHI